MIGASGVLGRGIDTDLILAVTLALAEADRDEDLLLEEGPAFVPPGCCGSSSGSEKYGEGDFSLSEDIMISSCAGGSG